MTTTLLLPATDPIADGAHLQPPDEASSRRQRPSPVTTVERWRHTGMICDTTSNGSPTSTFTCCPRRERTSRSIARRWSNAAWLRQRLTGGSRRSVATTDSPTSTAEFRPTQPSTCADPRCSPPSSTAWTAASWAASCSPPSTTTAPTRHSPCCSVSTGCGSLRRAPQTSKTSRSGAGTAPCGSSARATSPRRSRTFHARPARSTWRSGNDTKVRSCNVATANAWTDAPPRPLGALDRQASRPWCRPPAHAACSVHYRRVGCRRPAARRAARSSSRRPAYYDDLPAAACQRRSQPSRSTAS